MQWLAEICVRRPVFATVLMLLLSVFGFAGYRGLGLDQFPNVDLPFVIVTTVLPGAAPEEMESDVTDKIESAISTVSGIEMLRSTSAESVSQVMIQFALEKDGDVAAQEVRDKIDILMADLPQGIEKPIVTRVDPDAAPVMLIAIKSTLPLKETSEIADKKIRRELESIFGVGQVSLIGARKRQVNVWLDPAKMRAFGMTTPEVRGALAMQNLTAPGGNIETGPTNLTLRVAGRVASIEELERIVVRQMQERPIRLMDVARVEDGMDEEKSLAALNGNRVVVLSVRKQSGQNTVEVVDSVNAKIEELRGSGRLPSGITLDVVRDNSEVVRTGLAAVEEHLIVGAILAALVVLLFLGSWRSTVIAALAIPISIIGTFAVMKLAGFTLNFLTLLALALAVGIVIDDAIVVLENIVRYMQEKGVKPFPAAVLATREIGMAVLATTLSLMAVFVPVAFMIGIPGRFLRSFGLTMAFSIAVSMLVSFTLTPMLAARWITAEEARRTHEGTSWLGKVVNIFYRPIERTYMIMLEKVLHRRWIVVLASVIALGSCGPIAKALPKGFLPPNDQGQFEISLRAPEGTSLAQAELYGERVARMVREMSPEVLNTLVTIGDGPQQAVNVGKVLVLLTDPKLRDVTQDAIMDRVRKEVLASLPADIRTTVTEVAPFSTGQTAHQVQMSVTGPDLAVLNEKVRAISTKLRAVPGAVDVDDTVTEPRPEIRAEIARDRAADLGVKVAEIAETLRLFVGGIKATNYAEAGEQYDVRLRADAVFRGDPRTLALISVPSNKEVPRADGQGMQSLGSVPLNAVVDLSPTAGPSEIHRLGRQREATIMANPGLGVGESFVQESLQALIAAESLPGGYKAELIGRSKESARLGTSFLMVFALAFIFMYLVLAAQFESWVHPLTILLTLPLTVPFAFISLAIFGQSLNLFSGLGLLVLFGVVKKNAILQIDRTNQLRAQGMERLPAMLAANRDRLRPILMTTLAFVAGMLPLITSKGIGADQNRTTGAIIFGGQSLSLLLTLLAVPVIYSYLDDAGMWGSRMFKRLRGGSEASVDDDDPRGERELEALLKS